MDSNDNLASEHRHRLLEGLAQAVAEKGYADVTIADIVREAGVSRRTFYEHFAGKPQALIALFEAASRNALQVLRAAIDSERDWQAQVEQAMTAYLGCLAQNPVLLRTLFIDILGLGAPGLAARRRVNGEIARFMGSVINAGQATPVLDDDMAMAVVGGIHELVLQAIEQERLVAALPELADLTGRLVRAVVQGESARRARPKA
ncbi:TetR/AcrR family transcriptional regulator [Rhodoferax sediminis]|uniref:TetR/AcrR family transcriptional regulator n=1 Tax=Rhodoferax sediminis TaxID=2509614 RepID=A0A515DAQ8_9BURK|nr:TetR/AcrR family transcriptional regulator [Rhodoferax sediminis]QDL37502.1 TetR/AcrR family transcriptional regulator [Rhodoferax sediminis]